MLRLEFRFGGENNSIKIIMFKEDPFISFERIMLTIKISINNLILDKYISNII